MQNQRNPPLNKWPFYLGDALLLGTAGYVVWQGTRPLGTGQLAFVILCVVLGAVLSVTPFLLEYRGTVKLAEAEGLATVVSQIQNLEKLAAQITTATGQWQEVQEQSEKTAAAAQQISERMSAEVKGFAEFMERMSDREKATLRLEVDKARRAETEWLQVLVRMLDHVYALHVGAVRSSQPHVIEQVGNFQNACRDVARRVGLSPFTAEHAEPFDGQRHQLLDGVPQPEPGAAIAETIAAGYTFQGKLLRPALVRLKNGES